MLIMLLKILVVVILFIIAVSCIGSNDDSLIFSNEDITNDVYEKLFIKYVFAIDEREPRWIDYSLRELKRGYRNYSDNPRALSTLSLLEEVSLGMHPEISKLLLSCSKYQKRGVL